MPKRTNRIRGPAVFMDRRGGDLEKDLLTSMNDDVCICSSAVVVGTKIRRRRKQFSRHCKQIA